MAPDHSKRPPSIPDLLSDITGKHRAISDPPGARWLDRRIGRAIRLSLRWWITTKGGTALTALISALLTWLSHHLTHWMGP